MTEHDRNDMLFWRNLSLGIFPFENVSLEMLISKEWSSFSNQINLSIHNLTELIVKAQWDTTQRDTFPVLLTITIFYAVIFVAGILGNLITCIVIYKNKSMHTATNYYLFNLAISDLILLLSAIPGMPPDLFNIWYPVSYPFSKTICILEGVFSETAANATVLTITAFTVERYIAICHPFRQHTMSKLSRAVKFIMVIWLTAFISGMPQSMQFDVISEKGGTICSVKDNYIGHVFAISSFIFFVGPMTAICFLYVLIGIKLKKSKIIQGVKRNALEMNRGISAQTRVIRMLVAVAVAFFLCWAPFHSQRLMAVYGSTVDTTTTLFDKTYSILTYTSGVMYFLSTCVNPLLYNIMSHKFRDAFKMTLARLGNKYQIQNRNYNNLSRRNGITRSSINSAGVPKTLSNRPRYISISSQSTILTSSSKNDVLASSPLAKIDKERYYLEGVLKSDNIQLQKLYDSRKESLPSPKCNEGRISE